ncbi:MAG TPA: transposase [Gammaproteobacteria bacterium]|nr:transposase [Gammaproteobacteria bacterium]
MHDKRVVKLYKTRMQIEEGFRDLKSSRYGLSIEQSYSKGIVRLENLLLIAITT